MKAICFYFQIHQPAKLGRYRFFNIGNDHYYYDDFAIEDNLTRLAASSYIPTARTLLKMIEESDRKFRCAISISGVTLDMLNRYVPEYVELLRKLAATGCVEFLSETFSHSLASLASPEEFARQVRDQSRLIFDLFGQTPVVLRNTELIYCDEMAPQIQALGFKGVITEGAKHILGWKSPNYVYAAAEAPDLKLLLKNDDLSDRIAVKFTTEPYNAEQFLDSIASTPKEEEIFNIFLGMETFGEILKAETGIFQFLEALPNFAEQRGISFITPGQAVEQLPAVAVMPIPHLISWTDETRDTTAWLGNDLQNEAFRKLYSQAERVALCTDRRLKHDWNLLQDSDNLRYMTTKPQGAPGNPYESPFDAFTNYMNILADFLVRVEEQYPTSIENEELNSLLTTIRNQSDEITTLKKELSSMRKSVEHYNEERRGRLEPAPEPAPEPKKEAEKEAPKPRGRRKAAPKKDEK